MGMAKTEYPHQLTPGAPADLVLVKAPTWHEALQYRPADRIVFRAGRVVAQTDTVTRFSYE
jgi:cytosine/adenosine deaminase-related metal-dependent hydrolase